ncbi:hypothetical protein QJS10_CPA01g01831 [Acorus calamus]|uniref:Uncharacterized protein n=1 Tax=Acorus calamus TaxID=4465 RepID=A0AAV9FMD7_ACOCL|nr:hypothetical protein QJS10_CPA01g01831 [Acorus calamus]
MVKRAVRGLGGVNGESGGGGGGGCNVSRESHGRMRGDLVALMAVCAVSLGVGEAVRLARTKQGITAAVKGKTIIMEVGWQKVVPHMMVGWSKEVEDQSSKLSRRMLVTWSSPENISCEKLMNLLGQKWKGNDFSNAGWLCRSCAGTLDCRLFMQETPLLESEHYSVQGGTINFSPCDMSTGASGD